MLQVAVPDIGKEEPHGFLIQFNRAAMAAVRNNEHVLTESVHHFVEELLAELQDFRLSGSA